MFCFVLIESPPSGRIHILYANLTDWSVLYICSTQQKWKVARCLTPEHLLFSVSEKKKTTTKKHFDQNSLQSAFMMMNVSHSGKHSRKANSSPGNGKVVKGSLFFCGVYPCLKTCIYMLIWGEVWLLVANRSSACVLGYSHMFIGGCFGCFSVQIRLERFIVHFTIALNFWQGQANALV